MEFFPQISMATMNSVNDHNHINGESKQFQNRFPYVGSTKIKFRYRINNYNSIHRKFRKKYVEKDLAIVIKKSKLKQLFHEQNCPECYQGIESWSVTLIDQVEDLDSWINRLNTWAPNDLNVRDVYEAYNWVKK